MTIKESHEHNDTKLSHEARELVLHADNDPHLYRTSHLPVAKNMERKYKKGVYDHGQAKKAWKYHADRAAQSYAKQYGQVGGPKWHEIFSVKDRNAAAAHFADHHHSEMTLGNFHKESVDHAAEIVWAALENKPVGVNKNLTDALIERSKEIVEDKRIEMAGTFIPGWEKKNG